jgi:hypothetical protein
MSLLCRREVLDATGDTGVLPLLYCDDVAGPIRRVTLARFELDTPTRQPASFQPTTSQEPQT